MSDSDYEVRLKTTGRNDHCPCGSGRKYKKCHLAEDEGANTAALQALKEEAMAKAKASKDKEGEVDTKSSNDAIRSAKPQKHQPGPKGRVPEGIPKNIARRGAI